MRMQKVHHAASSSLEKTETHTNFLESPKLLSSYDLYFTSAPLYAHL